MKQSSKSSEIVPEISGCLSCGGEKCIWRSLQFPALISLYYQVIALRQVGGVLTCLGGSENNIIDKYVYAVRLL